MVLKSNDTGSNFRSVVLHVLHSDFKKICDEVMLL